MGNVVMKILRLAAMLSCSLSMVLAAAANPLPPMPKPDPNAVAAEPAEAIENLLDRKPEPLFSDTLVPYAPSVRVPGTFGSQTDQGPLYLMAKLTRDTEPLNDGLIWRIYSETTNDEGRLELVAKAEGGDVEFRLDPGAYLIHTAYGHATATNRIVMGRDIESKMVILNAGGIKLEAALSETESLNGQPIFFDIYGSEFNERGERNLVAGSVSPGRIIRLNADTYHIVSRYGNVNAVIRADIQVIPGKLTEATIFHNAADITLKLVNAPGGEAIANTRWSVHSPGGDLVVEANGAFPDFVLAAGDYEVIARNNGQTFTGKFSVASGIDREVEVVAAQGTRIGNEN